MKELILPLKKKWFDLIKSGIKKEEYREYKEFWKKRLLDKYYEDDECRQFSYRYFDKVTFTCGYPAKDDKNRRITFTNPTIRIGYGREEWGAQKGELYFIISWDVKN